MPVRRSARAARLAPALALVCVLTPAAPASAGTAVVTGLYGSYYPGLSATPRFQSVDFSNWWRLAPLPGTVACGGADGASYEIAPRVAYFYAYGSSVVPESLTGGAGLLHGAYTDIVGAVTRRVPGTSDGVYAEGWLNGSGSGYYLRSATSLEMTLQMSYVIDPDGAGRAPDVVCDGTLEFTLAPLAVPVGTVFTAEYAGTVASPRGARS